MSYSDLPSLKPLSSNNTLSKLTDLASLSITQLANLHQRYHLDVRNNPAPLSILQFSAEVKKR